MHLVGFEDKPPSWTIYGMADVYTGLCTSFAIMQALFMRERTGEGQFVDSAMLDNMISLNERMVMLYSITGEEPHRGRLKHLYPRGAFKCRDGYLALNVPDDLIWARLCRVIEREDLIEDERSRNGTARASNADFLCPIIESWLKARTREEAEKTMNSSGIPVGPVYTAKDIFASAQVKARKMLLEIEDPDIGKNTFSRGPVVLSSSPEPPRSPAPELGQNSREILKKILEKTDEEISQLANAGIIQLD
jgi:crotonobetainyl-CoA:carnitine CoA-transferase CaiB-like acyl-CoA transferase